MSESAEDRRAVAPVPGTSRRAQFSASTRRALVDVAERLFTEHGYAATSLDAIVAGADVTKGALYHHYSGKQALFEAVFERVESAGAQSIQDALTGVQDPWDKALSGLRAFLEVVRQPSYSRIVIQDGPSVLGYERFREQEEASTYALVDDVVRSVLAPPEWGLEQAMLDTFTRIFFGALSAAGVAVAGSGDAAAAAGRAEAAVAFILTGLREQLEAGRGPQRARPGVTSRT